MKSIGRVLACTILAGFALAPVSRAQVKEIRFGQTMPYSGPASLWGIFGKAASAYFAKLNDDGGIDGYRLNFLSYDDSYSPPKALEQTRKLVEQEKVQFIFGTGGTAVNTAIQRYLNDRKIPQLFITSGGRRFTDHANYPWTIGWQPTFEMEARIYTRHALSVNQNAKIAVLYQNDDFGREFLKGVEDTIKESRQGSIVATASYEPTDPSVETQVIKLKSSGADVFFNFTTPKFTVQAIKKTADLGWKPMQFIYTGSASVSQVFGPAGVDNSTGVLTGAFLRDPSDPAQQRTKEYADYIGWMKKYLPDAKPDDVFVVFAYSMAQTMEYVLRQAGGNFSKENLLKQATSIKGLQLPMLLPGVVIETAPNDYRPIKRMQIQRFDGKTWQFIGGVVKG